MKTTRKTAALLLATSLGLAGFASAAQERQNASEAKHTNNASRSQNTDTTLWHRAGAPFRFAGRAGRTVLRSPMIIGETFTGERKFISKNGLMAAGEPDAAPAEQSQISVPMGRGERIPIFVDRE